MEMKNEDQKKLNKDEKMEKLNKDEIAMLPLGGAQEIGSCFLYNYHGKWLMVDLGVSFADDLVPGAEVVMPDISFIEEHKKDLLGLVITHGHEDHLGGIPYLWDRLRCPIYCTKFASKLIINKLMEKGIFDKKKLMVKEQGERFMVGDFDLEFMSITHSIPEANFLIMRTQAGNLIHTGDWNIDENPLIGEAPDFDFLEKLGKEGLLAVVGDSIGADSSIRIGSEREVRENLKKEIAKYKGRVVVTCFASNVSRLESVYMAAIATGRKPILVGRSMWKIYEAAQACGYLLDCNFLEESDAEDFSDNEILFIMTGSQGEPNAVLWRVANREHRSIRLRPSDTVIFSSRVIPGNEDKVERLKTALIDGGAKVVSWKETPNIHVGGHAAADEIKRMYEILKPETVIPIMGEPQHLRAHAAIARECKVPNVQIVQNGEILKLKAGSSPEKIDMVPTGIIALDGNRLIGAAEESVVFKQRRKASYNGVCFVTVAFDGKLKMLGKPDISLIGLADEDDEFFIAELVQDSVKLALEGMRKELKKGEKVNDQVVTENLRVAVRRAFMSNFEKKPEVKIHALLID
jgi:ribonuclease J